MFCSKCGSQNINGERFCKNCGILLENNQPQQTINNTNGQIQQSMNIDKAVNPNMKIWAILSIIVPIIGILWFWFIGLSLYLAILIACVGYVFSDKGKVSNKKLSNIGNLLNGIFIGMVIVVFTLNIINIIMA